MECPACGHEYILGDDSCGHCGGDLTQVKLPRPRHGRIHQLILEDPISQLNAPEPICLRSGDTVAEAVARMKRLRYGSVLVVDSDRRLEALLARPGPYLWRTYNIITRGKPLITVNEYFPVSL